MKNRVRELRESMGLTQEELADRLKVTRQTIHAIESGKYSPTLGLAFKISRLFNQPIEELLTYSEEER